VFFFCCIVCVCVRVWCSARLLSLSSPSPISISIPISSLSISSLSLSLSLSLFLSYSHSHSHLFLNSTAPISSRSLHTSNQEKKAPFRVPSVVNKGCECLLMCCGVAIVHVVIHTVVIGEGHKRTSILAVWGSKLSIADKAVLVVCSKCVNVEYTDRRTNKGLTQQQITDQQHYLLQL
jgi:hypothetical protein